MNALSSTPSVQPIRAAKGAAKPSVKRSAETVVPSYHMNKRNVTIPTTSAPPTAQSFSRFGQSTTMPATNQMNQMPQMSMSFQPIQLQASDSNWQVCRTPTGVEYYYNKLTRVTTYNKPDELKSEAERALKVCVLLFNIIT